MTTHAHKQQNVNTPNAQSITHNAQSQSQRENHITQSTSHKAHHTKHSKCRAPKHKAQSTKRKEQRAQRTQRTQSAYLCKLNVPSRPNMWGNASTSNMKDESAENFYGGMVECTPFVICRAYPSQIRFIKC